MQQLFRFFNLLNSLALFAILLGFQGSLRQHRPPLDLHRAVSRIEYVPVAMRIRGDGARIAGAWEVRANDPRLSGVSGLAVDGNRLLALTDSGMIAWLDLPGSAAPRAALRALPVVAGNPMSKIGRDSEAIARDPRGRGWWVAFEQQHSLLLYDPVFEGMIMRIAVGRPGFAANRGVEAIAATRTGVGTLPESSGISDAVRLADGRQARLVRRFTLLGFVSGVEGLGARIALPLGRFDNPEGIAAAPLANGGTRLWTITDNDGSRWRPTLLVAVDLPSAR